MPAKKFGVFQFQEKIKAIMAGWWSAKLIIMYFAFDFFSHRNLIFKKKKIFFKEILNFLIFLWSEMKLNRERRGKSQKK